MFNLKQRKNGRPLLVGHRGAMAVAPENTLPAFTAGLAGGADILELDVQLSRDGQVMLFHDENLLAKTGIPGRVADHDAAYLQTLDVGRHFGEQFSGVTMPRLADILTWAKGQVALMIELKHGPVFNPALDQATVRLVAQHGMVDEVILSSFDQAALQRVKQLNPAIATSFIYVGRFLDPLLPAQGLTLDALSPATNYLTAADVATIRQAGYACSPGGSWWDYPTLASWGVDTVSSNNPAGVRW